MSLSSLQKKTEKEAVKLEKDEKLSQLIGSMCLDIPIISSFVSEEYAEYALRNKMERKEADLEDGQVNLYYEVAR